jgi:hypothetical protein
MLIDSDTDVVSRVPWLAMLCLAPLLMCAPALMEGLPLGSQQGEVWGHLFTALQCERWATGAASIGTADLLNAPAEQPFWPVNPALQVVGLPLQWVFGHVQAWNLLMMILLVLAGLGPALLCRRLQVAPPAAALAGLLVQLSPFLLRNLRDSIIEVASIGVMALCIRALIPILRSGSVGRRTWWEWMLWLSLLAGTSPYFFVYLAVGLGLLLPWLWWAGRRLLKLGVSGAGVAVIFLLPFMISESGSHGRLGPDYARGGYQLEPAPIVLATGQRAQIGPMPQASGEPGEGSPEGGERLRTPKNPVGWTLSLGFILAVSSVRSRRWALGAAALFVLGPGATVLGRALHAPSMVGDGPLSWVLRHLPLLSSMGNTQRLLAPLTLLIAVGVVLAIRRRWLMGMTGALAVFEAWLVLGGLSLPRVEVMPRPSIPTENAKSVVVFPSGESPYWSWRVGPKESLFIAAREGLAVAQDYGRGRLPGDLMAHLTLARVGEVGLGREAWKLQAHATTEDLPDHLFLLESRLDSAQVESIREWLGLRGELLSEDVETSTWRVDSWQLYAATDPSREP